MTAFIASSYFSTTLNLTPGDSLFVTREGTVTSFTGSAIIGAGANALTIHGMVHSNGANSFGILLNGGNSAIDIAAGGIVGGQSGIKINGGNNSIVSSGSVFAGTGSALDVAGGTNTISLNATSDIRGETLAVRVEGASNSFANTGRIYGDGTAVVVITGGSNTIFNGGAITGGTFAALSIGGVGASTLVNTGLIQSFGDAIRFGVTLNLTNAGRIDGLGGGVEVFLATASQHIVNNGYIIGRISYGLFLHDTLGVLGGDVVINNGFLQGGATAADLFAGNDFFDGRNGLQFGVVSGGDHNDVLYGGAGADDLSGGNHDDHLSGGANLDRLDGGSGFDLARYDFSPGAVTVSLANPAANTGEAAGDTFISIEGLVGSNFADVLVGNGTANTLIGGAGADAIAGGAGIDTLFGGAAGDTLFGEADADLIIGGPGGDIIRSGPGGDLIMFNAGDNGDLIVNFNEGGVRDGFDLRGYFNTTGFAGTDPRGAGIMAVLQNGADTDIYLHGAFAFRIQGVVAAAVDDTYFLFQ